MSASPSGCCQSREPRAKGPPYPQGIFETQSYSRPRPEAELKAWKLVSDIVLIWGRRGEDGKVYLKSYLVFREHQGSQRASDLLVTQLGK